MVTIESVLSGQYDVVFDCLWGGYSSCCFLRVFIQLDVLDTLIMVWFSSLVDSLLRRWDFSWLVSTYISCMVVTSEHRQNTINKYLSPIYS